MPPEAAEEACARCTAYESVSAIGRLVRTVPRTTLWLAETCSYNDSKRTLGVSSDESATSGIRYISQSCVLQT